MATTEVLLLKYIKNLGSEGDQIKVRAGYARNYLFPNELALPLTYTNKKQIEALQRAREIREKHDLGQAQTLADQLSHTSLAIVVKTGENGRMFGAVTAKEICDHFAQKGVSVDKKKIHLNAPIKEVGRHKILVKLHADVSLELQIDVVSENPMN
ncbi:MAG: 50S ribosomal protein L9 [Puniceicoccales bacterium]|jgi:large subunit ribosomal protein L9|nr:50S ribosomal protein L9 [Puniceicoccales bacterium]